VCPVRLVVEDAVDGGEGAHQMKIPLIRAMDAAMQLDENLSHPQPCEKGHQGIILAPFAVDLEHVDRSDASEQSVHLRSAVRLEIACMEPQKVRHASWDAPTEIGAVKDVDGATWPACVHADLPREIVAAPNAQYEARPQRHLLGAYPFAAVAAASHALLIGAAHRVAA